MNRKYIVYDIIFILFVTAACHILFSRFGFNPTDEGFVLSATDRVMHGQVPHVDFSSVRPLGYAYLHIPELLISKNYFFLVSRFVFWLENVLIAFLWVRLIYTFRAMKKEKSTEQINRHNFYLFTILTFIFNVHYFPCSVLHTIDGLLFCLIGLNIIASQKKFSFIGFIFIGFAALCKQNYLIVLPVALFLFGRKDILIHLLAGIFPIVLYIGLICSFGGWDDLTTQLSGHNELLDVGFKKYLFNYFFIIGIAAAIAVRKLKAPVHLYIGGLLLLLTGLLITGHYHGSMSFLIMGILLAEYFYATKNSRTIIFICLTLAWCVSISVGYNTPALFSGACFSLLIIGLNYDTLLERKSVSLISLGLLVGLFHAVRTHLVYRDAPASILTHKLDGIAEGANGIYTNKNTFEVMKELDSVKKTNPSLVVIPDFTACNVLHAHQSKIRTEWPNKTEIPNTQILTKVTASLQNDTALVFAIPKFQTALLKDGFTEIPDKGYGYPIVRFVKDNYPKETETKFFELRRK